MGNTKCTSCGDIIENGFENNPVKSEFCSLCIGVFANCGHQCTSNCRREGCNCDCGEYHVETKI